MPRLIPYLQKEGSQQEALIEILELVVRGTRISHGILDARVVVRSY